MWWQYLPTGEIVQNHCITMISQFRTLFPLTKSFNLKLYTHSNLSRKCITICYIFRDMKTQTLITGMKDDHVSVNIKCRAMAECYVCTIGKHEHTVPQLTVIWGHHHFRLKIQLKTVTVLLSWWWRQWTETWEYTKKLCLSNTCIKVLNLG